MRDDLFSQSWQIMVALRLGYIRITPALVDLAEAEYQRQFFAPLFSGVVTRGQAFFDLLVRQFNIQVFLMLDSDRAVLVVYCL